MKLRNLYTGTRAFSYIIFDKTDTSVTENLLDELDAQGYRYWFSPKLKPDEDDLQEISGKLDKASAAVLVLTKGVLGDAHIKSMVEYALERRKSFAIYAVDYSAESTTYMNSILERAKNPAVVRAWEQTFDESRTMKQVLSQTKGLTESEAEKFYLRGISVFEGNTPPTRAELAEGMKNVMYAAGQEYAPALVFLGNYALEMARQGNESYSTAIAYFKAAVKLGNTEAIYNLGCMIEDGEGFAQNYEVAAPYISMAALKGIPDAQYRFADMLDNGYGMPQNREEATKWYIKALDNGDKRSYLPLAHRYLVGEHLRRDENVAARYFIASAEEDDNVDAIFMLAKLYRDGVGVRKDMIKSEEYFRRSAENEIIEAQYEYALILLDKGEYSEAFKWLNYAAIEKEYGKSAPAHILYKLGQCYSLGYGTEIDRKTAFLYYHKAALAGNKDARAALSECYRRGVGVAINKRAAEYYAY